MLTTGSLAGIKVIDLSRMLPGPYCSMVLADHGAEVISIEKKEFRDSGLFFGSLYRNKKHMTLDLKTNQGREILSKLLNNADVLIEGFRPGVMARLGFGYETTQKINRKLIYCSISGYGQKSDKKHTPGHDVNYLSHSGIMSFMKSWGNVPRIPGVQIADIAGGAQNAVIGILLALFAREKTGEGQYVDISITDGLLGLLHLPLHYHAREGVDIVNEDSFLSHRFACYNTYATKDGRFIALGALEKPFWAAICTHFKREDLIDLQYDEDMREDIIEFFENRFLEKNYTEWVDELEPLNACCSGIKTLNEVLIDPDFKARQMLVESGDKSTRSNNSPGVPVQLSSTPGSAAGRTATFGGDTTEILARLGYSKVDMKKLVQDGIV